ncbi:hypothetical protein CN975_09165 [Bacillus cereus]|uniref:hypothetical protein n=1 Tax=Bacillus TaxID=1386 RepID=UPI000BF8A6A1|nr:MULTISPECIES: hypothetical protein [Bacillus]KAF6697997.1 hypothetical protein HFD78_18495 [Bacillus sp. EKM501B]MEB9543746.1 hypothetical protein [Bacillus cereus]PEX04925.1 hypothetical protein CN453_05345 [Bacillus cereus]PFF12088.1 hypothetical protein CN343_20505 [Bacillus cereus]PGL04424.1 hypothetical protein CN915_29120 [Bacillus cereus]
MELLGLDMVAQQLPAITDAAVLGNINFGVNIKNWLVAQLGPIFLVCAIVSVFVFSPDVFKDLGTKLYNLVFK